MTTQTFENLKVGDKVKFFGPDMSLVDWVVHKILYRGEAPTEIYAYTILSAKFSPNFDERFAYVTPEELQKAQAYHQRKLRKFKCTGYGVITRVEKVEMEIYAGSEDQACEVLHAKIERRYDGVASPDSYPDGIEEIEP